MVIWMLIGCSVTGFGQTEQKGSRETYLEKWKDEAIYQMAVYGIPASITLAQGILESGDGNSSLAARSNNHFGIKCHSEWKGETVRHDDDRKGECFRAYEDAAQSFEDHSLFLKKARYESLFRLDITDYKNWAKGLKKCGYATNPKYDKLLIDLIERHELTSYDQEGIALLYERDAFANNLEEKDKKEAELNSRSPIVFLGDRELGLSDNHIQFIIARKGDNYDQLAVELDMMRWQLYRYNDVKRKRKDKAYMPQAGDIIYLQPKRMRGNSLWFEMRADETLWAASQRSGVKLSSLLRKNRLSEASGLKTGHKLSLQWKIAKDGKLPAIVRMWGISSG